MSKRVRSVSIEIIHYGERENKRGWGFVIHIKHTEYMQQYTNREIDKKLESEITYLEGDIESITFKMEEFLKKAKVLRKKRAITKELIEKKRALLVMNTNRYEY